jgi:hypothetical protein
MHRIQIEYGQDMISVTRLTSRILNRIGRPVKILDDDGQEKTGDAGFNRFNLGSAVSTKQQVIENWDLWSSEEIMDRLEYLWATQETGVPRVNLSQTLDLWLLKALAQEKCLDAETKEIEETYHECRHLGRWNAVLVRNNLAVLRAKREESVDSLSLLAEAISLSIADRVPLKAPFYNAALVFQQLHQTGLISDPRYLELLNQITSTIPLEPVCSENGDPREPEQEASSESEGNGDDPGTAYRRIAKYGYEIREPTNPDLFQRSIAHLTPGFDLFESFGDFPDTVDSRTAHELFEKGIVHTDQEMFAEGIRNFELASQFDPAFSSEAAMKVEQVSEHWRQKENQRMAEFLSDEDYDHASGVIQYLDSRLKRDSDRTVVSSIKKLKHLALCREASEALKAGDEPRAKLLYVGLLKERDLEDSLRLDVSNRLAEPLKQLTDDAERYQELNELILHGAHSQVIDRLSDTFASQLILRAIANLQDRHYDLAIEKYFWALLLPESARRREELVQSSLFCLNLFSEANQDLDKFESLHNPLFADLKTDLKTRWNTKQDKATVGKFEKLDSEPWIIRKELDELMTLLDQLISYEPTTERFIAELRLGREKEAQQLFKVILEQLRVISKEGEHSRRRELVYGELRKLHDLAIDFASGEGSTYARQITDFVLKAEAYLAQADTRKFMHDMDFATNERHENEFIALKNSLKTDPDEIHILQTICDTLRLMRGTNFFEQTQELATYWLEKQGRARYQALIVGGQDRARAILEDSLVILRRNQEVLPEEFKTGFKNFLEEIMREIAPEEEPPIQTEPSSPPPIRSEPSAPSSKKGFAETVVEWIRSLF